VTSGRPLTIIVGLGATGLSCVRFLSRADDCPELVVVDTRSKPPGLKELEKNFPHIEFRSGPYEESLLCSASRLVLSPGVSINAPAILAAQEAGVSLTSDLDIFCKHTQLPIVAITGSNAKSTVTSLVGEMVEASGLIAGVGGNLGVPVLDLLNIKNCELYVLELSSFQLENSNFLKPTVAAILNMSVDHLDRHNSYESYLKAKQRVFRGCEIVVENKDDVQTFHLGAVELKKIRFGLEKPNDGEFGIVRKKGQKHVAWGSKALLPVDAIKLHGLHNVANAMAALALGSAINLPMKAMLSVLESFEGLPHRSEWIATKRGVDYVNDSKGTNPGATVAALKGAGESTKGKVLLIAGGADKGNNFLDLVEPVQRYCRSVALIGETANVIYTDLKSAVERVKISKRETLEAAVSWSANRAKAGDTVLLSPACASFDMFKNYQARGKAFKKIVAALAE